MTAPVIVWLRQELRRGDNPALYAAYDEGFPVIPLYILEDEDAHEWRMGSASRVWLFHSLKALDDSFNGHLIIQRGKAGELIPWLVKKTGARAVYWNRCYEPWRIQRDKELKAKLEKEGLDVRSYKASLLWEPWKIQTQDGSPYKVFTPFYKKGCLPLGEPQKPLPDPERLTYGEGESLSLSLNDLQLLPNHTWPEKLMSYWKAGEQGAQNRLQDFLQSGLKGYKEGRNFPAQKNVSRLSPHIHLGELSPRQIWHAAKEYAQYNDIPEKDLAHFHSELGWREFSYNLLYHFPHITTQNFQKKFDHFPWIEPSESDLKRWQMGQTGYPIVDAAMRELYETGYMHNRCRMIVGSFLVKNMMVHWRYGESWFWDTLLDADLANNSASWQWIAGSGADAAPYFRIFNPMLQSEKFDPEAEYIRTYVPELKKLSDQAIHAPWDASQKQLEQAGVQLGKTYPHRMMPHSDARERALKAFEELKTG